MRNREYLLLSSVEFLYSWIHRIVQSYEQEMKSMFQQDDKKPSNIMVANNVFTFTKTMLT